MKASIFITCICDSIYPRVGQAMVRVLEKQGVTLQFSPQQTCCGQPALNSGYWEEARTVARGLLKATADSRYVVTPAGSCLVAIREMYLHLFADDERYRPLASAFIDKAHEFSDFMVNILQVTDVQAVFPYRVTYHSSCHPRRFLNSDRSVYALLQKVRDIDFVPMAHEDLCCGFGGTFSVKMPEISEAMVDEKVAHILATQAEVLVGTDLSCLMNIEGRLKKQGSAIRVMHIAELLDEGMRQ